jgi:uncharacterized protein (TIGR00251 family)
LTVDQVTERLAVKKIRTTTSPYKKSYARVAAGIMNSPDDIDTVLREIRNLSTGGVMGKIWVHVVPGARENAVMGMHGDAVRIRIAARARDGAANAELSRFIAATLRVAHRAVEITAGLASRRKRLSVDGVDSGEIARALLATGQSRDRV